MKLQTTLDLYENFQETLELAPKEIDAGEEKAALLGKAFTATAPAQPAYKDMPFSLFAGT